jgi:class 3 adenylate cyclase
VIPIIYEYGGEIDKIIGDGIICIFGPPFLGNDLKQNIKKANDCAKALIEATEGKEYSSKVAFHCGIINYFKNKTGLYKEFTMIGKPLTEIFRLESVSLDERVNYYSNTPIRLYFEAIINRPSSAVSTSLLIKDCEGRGKRLE